jgi:pimeloyl-ACP methyl ester carboxylesterase
MSFATATAYSLHFVTSGWTPIADFPSAADGAMSPGLRLIHLDRILCRSPARQGLTRNGPPDRVAGGGCAPVPLSDRFSMPDGFWRTFREERVRVGEIDINVVRGGEGAPLLLIGGWPQTWHAWRRSMLALARTRETIVAEPRGFGESAKPAGPYDLATVAREMLALMDMMGFTGAFDLAGHDVGAWIAYAMAADFPRRVARLALLDGAIPGVSPPPSALAPPAVNNRVWHFGFNRLGPDLNEALVRGREDIFFSWQFRTKAGSPDAVPREDVDLYVDAFRDPDRLRAGFDYYRAIDANLAQNALRRAKPLAMPVFLLAGERGVGQAMVDGLAGIGSQMSSRILPGVGHYILDEAPDAVAEALLAFFGGAGN